MREKELQGRINELMDLVYRKDIEIRDLKNYGTDLEATVANLRLEIDVITGDYELKIIELEDLIEDLSEEANKLYVDGECLKIMNELKAPAPIPILVHPVLRKDETLDDVWEKQCSRGW